jgi:hypothetical protein
MAGTISTEPFGAEKARGDFLPVGGFYKTMHVLVACA